MSKTFEELFDEKTLFVTQNTSWDTAFNPAEYRKKEVENLTDWANAEYDPVAKARAEKAYGYYDPELNFHFGEKLARTAGIYDNPEQWFIQQKKPLPQVETPVDLYDEIARDFRADAKKNWEKKKKAEKMLDGFDLALTGWPADGRVCAEARQLMKGTPANVPEKQEPLPPATANALFEQFKQRQPYAFSIASQSVLYDKPFMPWPTTLEEYKVARAENLTRLRRMNEEDEAARQQAIIARQKAEEAAKFAAAVDCGFPALVGLVVLIQGWRAARRGTFGDWRVWRGVNSDRPIMS